MAEAALGAGRVGLRAATVADATQIAAIWNHEVRCTLATTDTEPRDPARQRAWLDAHGEAHPVVVIALDDYVLGYGALSPYKPKPAFARTVEDSVYVVQGRRGAGLGSMLLAELIRRAREQGHHAIMARITAENAASRRLHEGHGFRLLGVERETAFKFGRWHDITILQRLVS
jgi:phosphinothricin acetyltransferase